MTRAALALLGLCAFAAFAALPILTTSTYRVAFFLSVFWILFFGAEFWRNVKGFTDQSELRSVVGAFSGLLYYAFLYRILDVQYDRAMPFVSLAIAAVYFSSALIVNRRHGDDTGPVAQNVVSAMALIVVATAIQFTGLMIALYWSLEALVLLACGVRWKASYVWKFALALFALTFVKMIAIDGSIIYAPISEFTMFLNKRALTYCVFAASSACAALLFQDDNAKTLNLVTSGLHYGWSAVLLILCIVEVNDHFGVMRANATPDATLFLNFQEALMLSAVCMGFSRLIIEFGLKNGVSPLVHTALFSLALSLVALLGGGLSYIPIELFRLGLNMRAGLFLFLIVGLAMHRQSIQASVGSMSWMRYALRAVEIAFFSMIFLVLTVETIDFFSRKIRLTDVEDLVERWTNFRQMSLSIVWLIYSIILMVIGFWKRSRGVRIVSFVLFAVTILKIFIYDLSFLQTLYRIFSFIGLGIILLSVSYLFQRYKELIFGDGVEET